MDWHSVPLCQPLCRGGQVWEMGSLFCPPSHPGMIGVALPSPTPGSCSEFQCGPGKLLLLGAPWAWEPFLP